MRGGYATIVNWDNIKDNPPPNLKISPISLIPHKSQSYRAILDLSFALKKAGFDIMLVNEATEETAPDEAVGKLGSAIPSLIAAMAEASIQDKIILFMKLDIKDGFW